MSSLWDRVRVVAMAAVLGGLVAGVGAAPALAAVDAPSALQCCGVTPPGHP
jgi:hypothetical protein